MRGKKRPTFPIDSASHRMLPCETGPQRLTWKNGCSLPRGNGVNSSFDHCQRLKHRFQHLALRKEGEIFFQRFHVDPGQAWPLTDLAITISDTCGMCLIDSPFRACEKVGLDWTVPDRVNDHTHRHCGCKPESASWLIWSIGALYGGRGWLAGST